MIVGNDFLQKRYSIEGNAKEKKPRETDKQQNVSKEKMLFISKTKEFNSEIAFIAYQSDDVASLPFTLLS